EGVVPLMKKKGAGFLRRPSYARPQKPKLMSGFHHRLHSTEFLIYRALVDVPAFALRHVLPRQITHRREAGLRVDRTGTDHEVTLEWVDRDLRIRHRTIAVRHPIDVVPPELPALIVSIDIRLEPHF